MRKCSGKILAAVLTGFALASAVSAGTLAAQEGNRPAMGDVRRIQAYTDETVYGTGLVKVEVTYNNGVSLTGLMRTVIFWKTGERCHPIMVRLKLPKPLWTVRLSP